MTRQEIITSLENKLNKRVKEDSIKQEIADIYLTNFIVSLDKKLNADDNWNTLKNKEVAKIILKDKYLYGYKGCNWQVDFYINSGSYRGTTYRQTTIYLECDGECSQCQYKKESEIKRKQLEQKQAECSHDGKLNIVNGNFRTYLNCDNCKKQVIEAYTDTIKEMLFKKYQSEVLAFIIEQGEKVE